MTPYRKIRYFPTDTDSFFWARMVPKIPLFGNLGTKIIILGTFLIKILEINLLIFSPQVLRANYCKVLKHNLEAFQKPFPSRCQSLPLFRKLQLVSKNPLKNTDMSKLGTCEIWFPNFVFFCFLCTLCRVLKWWCIFSLLQTFLDLVGSVLKKCR